MLAPLLLSLVPETFGVQFTVSGHSSGGSMASQHFVAYSERILGLGHFQAAPYGCSKETRSSCLTRPQNLQVDNLVQYTNDAAKTGTIDNPSNMKTRPIWVFSGARDSIVVPGVVEKASEYYKHFSNNVAYVDLQAAQHAFVTDISWSGSNACGGLRTPFINNCGYDMPGAMFRHLYGDLSPRANPSISLPSSRFVQIDQSSFVPNGQTAQSVQMETRAFAYVPSGCTADPSRCRVHVMYHGCNSGVAVVGSAIYTHAGFNYWAETNNIIVLYPQTEGSRCWDWTGDVNSDYDSKSSLQMMTVNNMVDGLAAAIKHRSQPAPILGMSGNSSKPAYGLSAPTGEANATDACDTRHTTSIDKLHLPKWCVCY